jgi:type IV pilus assembly protein PilV
VIRKSRGFSLIEVMMTSVILGVGVLGLVNMYTSSARGVGTSRHRETATQIALQRIERLTTSPTETLPACGGLVGCRATPAALAPELAPADQFECTQYVSDMGSTEPTGGDDQGGYRLDTIVAPHPSSTQGSDARLISVSVCWTDASGLIQQVMMQRLALGDG